MLGQFQGERGPPSTKRVRMNREGWDCISTRYQAERGWPHEFLAWGIRCAPESELKILDDVKGRRVLVLGCGGGQDCVALWRLGATDIVGLDASPAQLEHAEALLAKEGARAILVQGSVEDLGAFPDGSFDTVVSVHVLTYVHDVADCFREAHRVLKPGGQIAVSVHHPMDATTHDAPPYGLLKPYFQVKYDWTWSLLGGEDAQFTAWHRPVTEWFRLLREAGFEVERMLEPPPSDEARWKSSGWNAEPYFSKLEWIPGTLILSARKPA